MVISLATGPRLYTPYFNEWNRNAYFRTTAFQDAVYQLPADSTSGAPVVTDGEFFLGLTRVVPDARFLWDGEKLQVEAPDDAIFLTHCADPDSAWEAYHRERVALPVRPIPLLPNRPEYCTWVEQKWAAREKSIRAFEALSYDLVIGYLEEIHQAGWPPGRFTVDEGWCSRHGDGGFGDWEPRAGLDMRQLADVITQAGHLPGIWLAPYLVSQTSRYARLYPEQLGSPFQMPAESGWSDFRFLKATEATFTHFKNLLEMVANWGFRKVKLDVTYGPRALMCELSALLGAAASTFEPPLELETHIPDPFASSYFAVVRSNDVLISDEHPHWLDVAEGHLRVCRESSPDALINLDHLGGNDCSVTETLWVRHACFMAQQLESGYPVISLLPRRIGPAAVEATSELLAHYPVHRELKQ